MTDFEELRQQLVRLSRVNGVTPLDILNLPAPIDALVSKMLKGAMNLDAMAEELALPVDETRRLADILVESGYLDTEEVAGEGVPVYKVYFAPMRKHNLPFDF